MLIRLAAGMPYALIAAFAFLFIISPASAHSDEGGIKFLAWMAAGFAAGASVLTMGRAAGLRSVRRPVLKY